MGLLDDINSGLQAGMQSPLFNLGAGLIAGSQPFANPGQQLMAAAGATQAEQAHRQQLYMQGLQMRMLRQQMPYIQSIFSQLGGLMGTPSKSPKGNSASQPASLSPTAGSANPAPVVGPFSAAPSAAAPGVAPPSLGGVAPGAQQFSGGVDPMQLMRFGLAASAFPMTQPMGKAAQAAAQFAAQYSPALQTQLALAKSSLTQDRAAMDQAQASGDTLGYKAALQKYLTDSKLLNIGTYNGAVTTGQGLTPQQLGITSTLPTQGIQVTPNGESPIPGAAATQQLLAGARAQGEAQGDVERVWNPRTQQWGYVPRSALLGGAPAAGATGGAGPLLAGPNPQASAYMSGTGTESARQVVTLQNAADAAQRSNFNLAQILAASQGVVTGPTAGARKWMATATAALTSWFGVAPPASLASYTELDKYGNQLAFAASRQLGSREAGQIVQLEMQSNPNKSNVPAALRDLVGAAHAANDYTIAQNAYTQRVAARNGGNALYAQQNFTSTADPRVWMLSISPELASKWAPRIGTTKIGKVLPYMLPQTAYNAFRNLPTATQRALVKQLDPQIMQGMIDAAR